MLINRIDHIVMTVNDIEKTIQFYTSILGMQVVIFGEKRKALTFGNQKINLHENENNIKPKAKTPTCGAIDLCFIVSNEIENVKSELENKGISIIEGIVDRVGAEGKIKSLYIRDPDQNLIELSNYK